MVIKKYDSFVEPYSKGGVGLNKDYISTATFDHNYKKQHYDSFIFGNSTSIFYQISDWRKHLDEESSCYHFDASGEGLYALTQKIKYIDNKDQKIKNVLLIIDYPTLIQTQPKEGHMTVISPQLVNYRNLISFHTTFFKAFTSFDFIYAYLDYRISGKVKAYMNERNLIGETPSENDLITNETRFPHFEELISQGKFYTEDKKKIFFKRDTVQKYLPDVIAKKQKLMLTEILNIFNKHKTKYHIIINPAYDQLKLSPKDLNYLSDLFGKENVFDFSGINKFTNDFHNYYETSHYRPHVAREIMDSIYHAEPGSNKSKTPETSID
jgi:hypothetical protein